jgi:deferrochelatase/peroxidase EfeB
MSARDEAPKGATRRGFLGALAAGAGGAALAGVAAPARAAVAADEIVPFHGAHQAGILTPAQKHAYFAAFDVAAQKRADVAGLMKVWSEAAAALSVGETPPAPADADYAVETDPAEMTGLSPSRLTITFGFGPSLFVKDGKDRFGLARQRPEAFVDLPNFPGDQFVPARSGGDLFVQICCDNPQVAFHAARTLGRLAYGAASIRWVQNGFASDYGPGQTPRNLMGFKDGTGNPHTDDPKEMDAVVWAGAEAPAFMRGGSYVVFRRSRMALEHWERTKIAFQEQTFGRRKLSGAPLGKDAEFDAVDLKLADSDGNPIVPENCHVGLARRAAEGGNRILRRSYSYNDGANIIAERWPPWRQGMEFDAGLLFVCFQRDLRTGFIPIFESLSRFDMMNQFVTNTGGAHFACPAGAAPGDYVGRALLES